MKRIFALIGVLLLAVAGVSYLYFSSLRSRTVAGYTQIVEAIPSDAILAYSFTNEKEYDDIFKSNTLFASLTGKATLDDFRQVKNFINQKNTLKQAFAGQTVFLSLHADTVTAQLNWLIVTALPKDLSWSGLGQVIGRYGKLKEVQVNGQTLYSLTANGMGKPVYFMRNKGLIALSFSPALLGRFLNNTGETPFIQLADQQNRTALAGLMVNYRMLPKLASIINRKRMDRIFTMLPPMNGSAATTITYNKSALLFNGFTRIQHQSGDFATLLYGQNPVKLNIDRILPDEIAAYTAVGISNYRLFAQKLDSLYQANSFGTKKKALQKQLSFNLSGLVQQQFAGEYALALMPNTEKMAFVKIKNGLKLKQFLTGMSENENDENISRFRYDNFPEAYFGPVFHDLRRPYFTVVDEYLVMANSYSTLNRYVQNRQRSRLLGTDDDYTKQKVLMADQGNMSWFVFLKNAKAIFRQQLKPEVYDFISVDDEPKLNDFDGFSLQLSVNGGEFYTNVCLRQGDVEAYDEKPVWEYNMGARLYGEPKIISGTDGKIILLEDASNRLHALNDSGKIIWQKQLNGHILGDVQTVNHALLFNTTRKIYQLNEQGEDVAGFPVDLAATATAGITMFNKTIIVPMGTRLTGYSLAGLVQPSWENSVSGRIRFPLKEAGFTGQNLLAGLTEQGYVYLFSADGKQQEKLDMNAGSAFPFAYALRTGSNKGNTCLISATKEGEIYRMYFDGRTEHEIVGVFTGKITFDCLNLSGDEKPEMIFLDARQLTVYTGNNTQAYNYLFTKPVKASVQVIDDRPVKRIGIRANRGNELYLFNDDGTLTAGFPFKGNSLFWAGDLYGNGQKVIILGEGSSAKAYALQ